MSVLKSRRNRAFSHRDLFEIMYAGAVTIAANEYEAKKITKEAMQAFYDNYAASQQEKPEQDQDAA